MESDGVRWTGHIIQVGHAGMIGWILGLVDGERVGPADGKLGRWIDGCVCLVGCDQRIWIGTATESVLAMGIKGGHGS